MILANSVTLGMADPCVVRCETPLCSALEIAEHVIFGYFALEVFIKMLAMGVFGNDAYFGEAWNVFDVFIVFMGLVEYLFAERDMNLSVIRTLRVFRPLRAINRIPSLRLLVTLILDILPMLSNVIVFCGFVFLVFGIISVQLWAGALRQRCFFPLIGNGTRDAQPPEFMPPFYKLPESDYICSPLFGMQPCSNIPIIESHNSMCKRLFSEEESLRLCNQWVLNYTECRPDGENPGHGTIHFDHIGFASLAIFQVVSLEGWVDIMYHIQDAFSFWAWTYFVLLVLLGSYFAVKLCLVVIAAQFSVTKSREEEKLKLEREARNLNRRSSDSSTVSSEEGNLNDSFYLQIINLISYGFRTVIHKAFKVKTKSTTLTGLVNNSRKTQVEAESQIKRGKFCKMIDVSRTWLCRVIDGQKAQCVLATAIVANAVIMGTEHHGQSDRMSAFIETANLVFTIAFSVELMVRLYAYGFTKFIREAFNALDTIIMILNIVELFDSQNDESSLSVLRLFRLFRLVKILRFFPSLQRQLVLMLNTVDNVTSFFLLLGFLMFVSALLGMNLFGCKFCHTSAKYNASGVMDGDQNVTTISSPLLRCGYTVVPLTKKIKKRRSLDDADNMQIGVEDLKSELNDPCTDANFDTLFQSAFTVLQIFTRDNWAAVMQDGVRATSPWASIYFVLLVTIGDYIIFNLLVGILVEGFSSKQEDALERKEVLPKLHEPQRMSRSSVRRATIYVANTFRSKLTYFWNGFGSDKSLFIFSPNHDLRTALKRIVCSKYYDKASLIFTLISCSVIVMERPGIDPNSFERIFIKTANYSINYIFLLEALTKIIAVGFILGQGTYLRNGWNILDFGLLILAGVDIAMEYQTITPTNKTIVNILRPIRLLRALRPLRVISRASGLKIVLKTLGKSVKPIGHIMLICCFFFLTFAILGVQLFRGCFAKCILPRYEGHAPSEGQPSVDRVVRNDTLEAALETVKSRSDCLAKGLQWSLESYNFDNVPNALMALFVFATLDGWSEITRIGATCVGPDLQPIRDVNPWSYVYFISFLLIVCFFALNMFVGVIVNNFQKVNLEEQKNRASSSGGRAVSLLRKISTKIFPSKRGKKGKGKGKNKRFWQDYPKWRQSLYKLMTSKYCEFAVMGLVMISAVLMAAEHYNMPNTMRQVFNIMGYIFLALLTFEMILKVVALGVCRYLRDPWNQLDLSVNVISLGGIVLEEIEKRSEELLPMNPSVVRIFRVFRIARVVRLLHAAIDLQHLLDTISQAIPQVLNLSLLFILLFFIYASLGVQMYSRFDCYYENCVGLSRHTNFENFGMALLTLFRIFTGDNWNLVLKDVMRMARDPTHCDDNNEEEDAGLPCNIVSYVSPFYFISFVLLAQFVLINIVVAVLMQQIENMQKSKEAKKANEIEEVNRISLSPQRPFSDPQVIVEQVNSDGIGEISLQSISEPNNPEEFAFGALLGLDALSVVSTDYEIQRHICDAEYLTARLKTLARPRRLPRRGILEARISSFSSLAPSTTTYNTIGRESYLSSSPALDTMSNYSQAPSLSIDPFMWQNLLADIRDEFIDKEPVITNLAELRRRQISGYPSSAITWRMDDSSVSSICLSDKFFLE